MTYRIECIEKCRTIIEIEADNEMEAEDKFQTMYDDGFGLDTDWSSCEMTFTVEPWY